MLDIKLIRNEPQKYRQGLEAKNAGDRLAELLKWDAERRQCTAQGDELKAIRNRVSDEIGQMKRNGQPAEEKVLEMKKVGQKIDTIDKKLKDIENQINEILIALPNIPHSSVKIGKTAADNVTVKEWGRQTEFDFPLKDHLDLAEALGILDFKRAAKVSGAGFPLYTGDGATLERALINFMLDFHRNKHGYKEIFPPFMVSRESAFGTGQLPKLAEDMYRVDEEDLFLIPTAEVPVTNIHRNEILPEDTLPLKYTAYSACFRREAGSYGKETRGLSRVHQFNKVELVWFTTPENSYQIHEQLLQDAEEILQVLNLSYRVVALCSGDLSFAAAKCYDIEIWAPGSGKYFEVSSVSNFEDFQARRANIRYRRTSDNKVDFVHT
ncbi:MAG: serine--tRNA ligase, partial [Candidatus Neomarinimicrobiota bacterium]